MNDHVSVGRSAYDIDAGGVSFHPQQFLLPKLSTMLTKQQTLGLSVVRWLNK
jgi:hypothetical protein